MSPTKGCDRYPLFHGVWVCRGSVYLRHGRDMQFMGSFRDLIPMPKPPPVKKVS